MKEIQGRGGRKGLPGQSTMTTISLGAGDKWQGTLSGKHMLNTLVPLI